MEITIKRNQITPPFLPPFLSPSLPPFQVTCPKEQHVLDHLVTPLPYTHTVYPDIVLSDHYPVLATLEL